MKHDQLCPKCRSSDIIPDARLLDYTTSGLERTARIATYENPTAFLFKGERYTTLTACVCGACGYVEFYAEDPKVLKV